MGVHQHGYQLTGIRLAPIVPTVSHIQAYNKSKVIGAANCGDVMKPENSSQKPPQQEKKKTMMGWFVSREEPDKAYLPDLKSQWAVMDPPEKVKFVLGAILGAVLFVAALVLVYYLLAAIVGWLGMG